MRKGYVRSGIIGKWKFKRTVEEGAKGAYKENEAVTTISITIGGWVLLYVHHRT